MTSDAMVNDAESVAAILAERQKLQIRFSPRNSGGSESGSPNAKRAELAGKLFGNSPSTSTENDPLSGGALSPEKDGSPRRTSPAGGIGAFLGEGGSPRRLSFAEASQRRLSVTEASQRRLFTADASQRRLSVAGSGQNSRRTSATEGGSGFLGELVSPQRRLSSTEATQKPAGDAGTEEKFDSNDGKKGARAVAQIFGASPGLSAQLGDAGAVPLLQTGERKMLWSDTHSKIEKDELANATTDSKKLPAPGDDEEDEMTRKKRIEDRLNDAKASGVARLKAVAYVAKRMDHSREQKKEQKLLEYYLEGLTAEDWMKRKIAVDESMDMILATISQAKAAQNIAVLDEQYAIVEAKLLPLLSDLNWRVRKSIIRGLHVLAKEEGRKVRSMLLPLISAAPTYAGRWCSAKLAMSIGTPSEEVFRRRTAEAMLKALSDEHWIVRQEAMEALPLLVQPMDAGVIDRGLELLQHEQPSLRRTGVEVLGRFASENARHDPLSDVQLAKRLLRTDLVGKRAFDACDVNGNGLLSVRELRTALRDKHQIFISLRRMVAFAKDLHDKDMTFFNFMDLVKSHVDPATEGETLHEKKEKVNKKQLAHAIIDGLLETLPVSYSPLPRTLFALKKCLEVETDWMTKDKVFGMCVQTAPFFDKDIPLLVHRGLSTFNAKLCLISCRTLLSLTTDLEEPAFQASLLRGCAAVFQPAREDAPAGMVEESWDAMEALSERLALPNLEVKTAVLRCLKRFWDKGAGTTEARKKAEGLAVRAKRFQQDAIAELNRALEQAAREDKAPVAAARRPSLVERAGSGVVGRRPSVSSTVSGRRAAGAEGKRLAGRTPYTAETFMALDHERFEHESEAVMDKFRDWYAANAELTQLRARWERLEAVDQRIGEQLAELAQHEDAAVSDDAAMLRNEWTHAQDQRRSTSNWKGAGMAAMVTGAARSGSMLAVDDDAGALDRTSSAFNRRRSSAGRAGVR